MSVKEATAGFAEGRGEGEAGGEAEACGVRRWPARLFLAIACSLVLLLVFEAAFWLVAPVRYHEWLIWVSDGHIKGRAEPNQVIHTAEGFEVRINSLGFRGPEYSWTPDPGTLRLAAFGGSSTFCYHASGEENTWPSRLQARLSEELDLPVEVVNLGLPGYDSANSKVNYLFLGRSLHPHAALLYHTWNDMKSLRPLTRGPRPFARVAPNKPLWQRIARATQIGRRARNAMLQLRLTKTENHYTSLEEEGGGANSLVDDAAFEWARRNLEDFVSVTRSDEVLPVLVSQATIVHPENFGKPQYRRQFHPDLVGMTAPVIHETWTTMTATIREVAEREGAVYVDGYGAVPRDFEHLSDHVHLTDRGADRLASEIAKILLEDERFLAVARRVRDEGEIAPSLMPEARAQP